MSTDTISNEIANNVEFKSSKNLYIESYGCAMNYSDSEIIASILAENGYKTINSEDGADVIFLNTCAIRENAESRIWTRLRDLKALKNKRQGDLVIGVLGCMAERLKAKLLEKEKLVDLVVGPDAYRDLPQLISKAEDGQKAVNVLLSREETYAEITPVRLNSNGINAFISIMRGCDNMCSFCVVPFTRGRERSRSALSIVAEAKDLSDKGYKEVTLLGQNVDSYKFESENGQITRFSDLLEMVAQVNPQMRVRFSTSHPKDITDDVLFVMAKYENICNYIHLPVQSGNSNVLERMNRNYDREWYMDKVKRIREIIPDCGISSDIISGFCGETEVEHQDTLSLMEWAQFDFSYMYQYSERPGTLAARRYKDDIPEEIKQRRLAEIISLQHSMSRQKNKADEGKIFKVLVEGVSKKSDLDYKGRNDQNKIVVFPKENSAPGQYVEVLIEKSTTTSLIGKIVNYL